MTSRGALSLSLVPLLAGLALSTTGVTAPASAQVAPGAHTAPATHSAASVHHNAAKRRTCQGERATIVGRANKSSSSKVRGTSGNDVIISNGASEVFGYGGDDLICITGKNRDKEVFLFAGPGDDSVKVKTTTYVGVTLGPGQDRYVGGPGEGDINEENDTDADTYMTYRGDDSATLNARMVRYDTFSLGKGDDNVQVVGLNGATNGKVDGGPGQNTFQIVQLEKDGVDGTDAADIVYDNRDAANGSLTRNGEQVLSWADFTSFNATDYRGSPRITFLGGAASEYFDDNAYAGSLDLDMGGGNDAVSADPSDDRPVRVDGGSGTDSFEFDTNQTANADLGAETLELAGVADAATWSSVERTAFYGGFAKAPLTVEGTPGDDHVTVAGCRVTVHALAGDDVVKGNDAALDKDEICGDVRHLGKIRIEGGPGRDTLRGSLGNDTLIGGSGSGRDKADGGQGRDRCVAEKTKRCES